MPGNHAILSPSGSSRWIACPGSIRMTSDLPRSEAGEAALSGTFIHQIGEDYLLGKSYEIGEELNVEGVGTRKITAAHIEEAAGYADFVKNIAKQDENAEIIAEMKVDLTSIAPETFGHSDAVVLENNTLHIVDLKTGAQVVSAINNSQMMLYAYGSYLEMTDLNDITNISMHIYQNNIKAGKNISTYNMSVEQLLTWIEEVAKPAATEALKEDSKCIPGEKQCQWCDAASFCKDAHELALNVFDDMTENLKDENPEIAAKFVTIEECAKFVENSKFITQLLAAYTNRLEKELQDGAKVKGFKLVQAQTRKKWVSEIDAYAKVKTWLPLDEVAPRKFATVTQIEKALGKMSTAKRNKFNDLWVKPEGQVVMAPESDKRPAIKPIVDDFENITEKIEDIDDMLL